MGETVFPLCCLTWGQTMVEVMKVMETSFKSSHGRIATPSGPNPTAGHRRPAPPQETAEPSSASVSVGPLGPGAHSTFEPSECLWRAWSLILNAILPLLPSCWGFSFALGIPTVLPGLLCPWTGILTAVPAPRGRRCTLHLTCGCSMATAPQRGWLVTSSPPRWNLHCLPYNLHPSVIFEKTRRFKKKKKKKVEKTLYYHFWKKYIKKKYLGTSLAVQ